jgi:CubicO group peptidase (beta-lactamase class C family)
MDRIIRLGSSDVDDYKVFPSRVIESSNHSKAYPYALNPTFGQYKPTIELTLESLLEDTKTMSFLVIHKDQIVYEFYGKGYDRSSINTSFSSVKSLGSLMIGIAIDKGLIQSEDDAISIYIDELKSTEIGKVTIKQLLTMRSPIHYEEGPLWFGDDAKTYYMPDLRALAVEKTTIDPRYVGKFHYNNYHPLLLGMVIENSTGKSVSEFFEAEIWSKMGTEYPASWSLDSDKSGFEKMESGLNFRAVDYAKIGSLILHKGMWNGERVVSEEWIEKSTKAEFPIDEQQYKGSFLEGKQTGYQYMWYSTLNDLKGTDIYAAGKYGQFIYISPENETVIVRTGSDAGDVEWWPDILKSVASESGRH